MKFFTFFFTILFTFFICSYARNASFFSAEREASVLASGKWVKIRVSETGIYKITYEDLVNWGFTNPSHVQVYGYGGWPLDERIDQPRINDLPKVGVWVEKGNDNIFNAGDYILFYGRGPVKWEYNSSKDEFIHTINPYSNYGYYFLTESDEETYQMNVSGNNSSSFSETFSSFQDYMLHEKDMVSITKSGREFYGESFIENTEQTFIFNIPGIKKDTNGKISIDFVSRTSASTPFQVSINNSLTINSSLSTPLSDYRAATLSTTAIWQKEAMEETNSVKVYFGAFGNANTYLNYIRLNFSKELKPYGAYAFFRNTASVNKNSKFVLESSSAIKIWNITDVENIYEVETTRDNATISFVSPANTVLQEYVMVDLSRKDEFLIPIWAGEVSNQNLHGLSQADMVIITHNDYLSEASRLADFHYEQDGLTCHVITAEEIYNEFSSGTPDASAYRWFMKMFYDRGLVSGNNENLPKYLLLFGHGIYDNRGIETEFNSRRLLTYQSVNSLYNGYLSYVSDDYFGFLDDSNNETESINDRQMPVLKKYKINIGIGRIPVKTIKEAQIAVDKIIKYTTDNIYDQWKNTVTITGDYGDNYLHMEQADSIAREYLERRNKEYIVNKIYVETYRKVSSLYPDAVKEFLNSINSGSLIVNYIGHGGSSGLSITKLITKEDAVGLTNEKLPLILTFTCGFSMYDQEATSTGEELLLNPNGGAIALISTVRTVNSNPNFRLAQTISEHLLNKELRLGDIIRLAKREDLVSNDENKLSYTLLGDPALKLAMPRNEIEVTKINDKDINREVPTLKAGENVTLTGFVKNSNNKIDENFSGMVYINLYDSKDLLQEIPKTNSQGDAIDPLKIYSQSQLLFIGKGEVKNGNFSLSFIIPKEINYSNESGKVNIYAVSSDYQKEAHGTSTAFNIGGTADSDVIQDSNPPKINAFYIGNSSFQNGNLVGPNSKVIIEVEDEESGINVSGSGIGHNASLTIDNSTYLVYNLNSFFENELNNPKKGKFIFPLPTTLSAGLHSMTFRVWDIMNNSSVQTLNFEISGNDIELIAIPDPANKKVTFFIENTSTVNEDVEIAIDVCDLSGKQIWQDTQKVNINLVGSFPISWNATVPSGIYVYKAVIKTETKTIITEAKRLLIK